MHFYFLDFMQLFRKFYEIVSYGARAKLFIGYWHGDIIDVPQIMRERGITKKNMSPSK